MTARRSLIRLAMLSLLGLLLVGCGQAGYDKLVKQQISSMGSWQLFRSDFGYQVKMPEGGTLTDNRTDEGKNVFGNETKEATWQSWFFRAEAMRIKDKQINVSEEADDLEQYYKGQGYTVDSRQDAQPNRLSAVDLRFSKPDSDLLAVRVVELDNSAIRLTISGPTLDNSIIERFFGSVERFAGDSNL